MLSWQLAESQVEEETGKKKETALDALIQKIM